MSTRIEESVSIPQDPAVVWPLLADPMAWPRWIEVLQVAESTPAGPLKTGSGVRIVGNRGPAIDARAVSVVDGRSIDLEANGLPFDLEARFEFRVSPETDGTRVTLAASTELSGMMIFAEKMVISKGSAALQRWLEALSKAAQAR